MTGFQVRTCNLSREIGYDILFLSLNERREKWQVTMILGKFVNKQ